MSLPLKGLASTHFGRFLLPGFFAQTVWSSASCSVYGVECLEALGSHGGSSIDGALLGIGMSDPLRKVFPLDTVADFITSTSTDFDNER